MQKIITLFLSGALLAITGCSGVTQVLSTDLFYKRDLGICVDNLACYEGVVVLPQRASYTIQIAPKGDANIDLLLATSCHREQSFEKTDSGWFIFKNRHRFSYTYAPVGGIEDAGDCALMLNTYEKDKGRHAWSFIKFEHPKYKLPATVTCNGVVTRFNGVSICQSKSGLIQRIAFDEPVQIQGDPECAMPHKAVDGKAYEFPITVGECGYTIRNAAGVLHDFTAIGYQGILVREQ